MPNLTQDQITLFMDDIGFLKKAIKKNTLIIQKIAITKSLRCTLIFSGIATIVLSFCSLLIKSTFGSYESAPLWTKIAFLATSIIALTIASILKSSGILHEAHHIDPKISLRKIALELYSHQIAHAFIPIIFLVFFILTLSFIRGYENLAVPVISIGTGLGLLLYYVLLRAKAYLFTGYWHLIIGCILLVFPSIGPEYGLMTSVGLGMLFLGLSSYFVKFERAVQEEK